MRVAKKSPGQRGDDEARRLVRTPPKVKPPRHDRRREHMDDDPDPDLKDSDAQDKDLSLNYKDSAQMSLKDLMTQFMVRQARTDGLIDPQLPSQMESLLGGSPDVDARHITLSREAEIVSAAQDLMKVDADKQWGAACPHRYALDHTINKLYGQPKVSAFVYDRMLRTLKGEDQPWPRMAFTLRAASRAMLDVDPVLAYDLNDALISIERRASQFRSAAEAVGGGVSRLNALTKMATSGLANTAGTWCQVVNWPRIALTIDQSVRSILTNESQVRVANNVHPDRYNALYASLFRGMFTAAYRELTKAEA